MLRPLAFVLALLAGGALPAQIVFGEMGFQVTAAAGTAGDACWGFSCAPRGLAVRAGERLTLVVRAPRGAPFVVVAGFGASSCLAVPGIWNQLVVGPPLIPLFAGTVSQPNGTRFCYDGFETMALAVPGQIPAGVQLGLQAVAAIGTPPRPSTGFGLSSAVLLRVQ